MQIKSITLILLGILCIFEVGAQVSRQTAKERITISFSDVKLSEAIAAIEARSNYTFFYDSQKTDLEQKVSLSVRDMPLSDALSRMLSPTRLDFELSNNQIILVPRKLPATLNGIVTDTGSNPLAGVTVMIEGTGNGTVTDNNGRFALKGVSLPVRLGFNMLGYEPRQVDVSEAGREIQIRLEESSFRMDDVVVVGYGVQKKVNLTGAVAVVDGSDLTGRSAGSMGALLQGQIPNMNITFSNGRPGAGGTFNIRGINSISSNATPLVLIDGVEGNINTLNPNDVASVTVLKDASSAAVYGARAAYGVILVTTKQGEEGKVSLTYNGRFSVSDVTTSTDFETRGYYSAGINDMFWSAYQGSNYTTYTDADYYQLWIRRNDKTEHPDRPWIVEKKGEYKYYGNYDWYNSFVDHTRPTWEHNLSVSGGNEKMRYWISGGYYSQDGAIRIHTDKYKRYNFRSRVLGQVNKWLSVSNNTSYHLHSYDKPFDDDNEVFWRLTNHNLASISPVNPDGTLVLRHSASASTYEPTDGMSARLLNGKNRFLTQSSQLNTTFEAVAKPIDKIAITANYTYSQYNSFSSKRTTALPYSKYPGVIEYSSLSTDTDKYREDHNTNYFHAANMFGNYSDTFGEGHNFSATAGANFETKHLRTMNASRTELLSEELNDFNLAKGEDMVLNGGQNAYSLFGLFFRLNYDYKGKYLLEVSGRYDGSSRFARGHRYGFFPSASAGWRISEENFFEPVRNWFNDLKLRVSYGSLGNQQVGYYDYIQVINSGSQMNYAFGDQKVPGASVSAPNAGNLTWETVNTSNIGIDLSFLKNRLQVTLDAYIRDTKDMLMEGKALPGVYGAASPKMNVANLRTKGWEASVTWNDSFNLGNSPFRYSVTVGVADNTSKITKYDNPSKSLSNPYVGMRLGEIWGYTVNGYFRTNEEAYNYDVDQSIVNTLLNVSVKDTGIHAGDMKFEDLDGNKILEQTLSADDIKDQTVIGNSLPRYSYSIKFSAEWKGVDLSVFFQGIGRQHWYPGTDAMLFWGPYARPYAGLIPSDFLSNVWSESNPDAFYPRARGYVALATNRELGAVNSKYLQNLAYCRLKNLTVGYSLPQRWMDAAKMKQVRVYFSGENLLTFTKLQSKYIDPEQASAENSWKKSTSAARVYPYAKTFSFGLDVTF